MNSIRAHLAELKRMLDEDDFPSDDEIDFSDIPETTEDWWDRATLVIPEHLQEEWNQCLYGEPGAPAAQVSVSYGATGKSIRLNHHGMRPMQERAYEKRGEQYLLIKSPPASGKSRALMFIALDKLYSQGIKQAIVAVPESMIGRNFSNVKLTEQGFWADWEIPERRYLCDVSPTAGDTIDSIGEFLNSDDRILLCTYTSLRSAIERFGVEMLDDRLVAIDELHDGAVSKDKEYSKLLAQIIKRNKSHIVAMTRSYFRDGTESMLSLEDEEKFECVLFSHFEQLNGYEHLKQLDIKFHFYTRRYADDLMEVLDPNKKTIVYIPAVKARERVKGGDKEAQSIVDKIGVWLDRDKTTGFDKVKSHRDGKILMIANLADDDLAKRRAAAAALRDADKMADRDYVDIIIAPRIASGELNWMWCEHAVVAGYGASLTETVQIIGSVTRDAQGKAYALFTNMISKPDATSEVVADVVSGTLNAIATSILMEQVLAPKFRFTKKNPDSIEEKGFQYGEEGYSKEKNCVGVCLETGEVHVEVSGLKEIKGDLARRICEQGNIDLVAELLQDRNILERGIFDCNQPTQMIGGANLGSIIKNRYPDLSEENTEAIRQRIAAALNLTQRAKRYIPESDNEECGNSTALSDRMRNITLRSRELSVHQIDKIDTFEHYREGLSVSLGTRRFARIAEIIVPRRSKMTPDEARELLPRIIMFKEKRGRMPSSASDNPFERMLADAVSVMKSLPKELGDALQHTAK